MTPQKRFLTRGLPMIGLLCAGCSVLDIGQHRYSCSGLPQGVQCLSARQVYQKTSSVPSPKAAVSTLSPPATASDLSEPAAFALMRLPMT
jgi:hypothetical protein